MSGSAQPTPFGVVGDPVDHSLSPLIHGFWLDAHGFNATYGAHRLRTNTPVADLKALARAGFGGLNVTLPYKSHALEAAAEAEETAVAIGAANTLTAAGGGLWRAANTDAVGFTRALDAFIGDALPQDALIIGAGGAARAVFHVLKGRGIAMRIVNRTPAKAERAAAELGLAEARIHALSDLPRLLESAAIVINTASLGHEGAGFAWPVGEGRRAMDISYGSAADRVLGPARAAGWVVEDGLRMLVEQAAASFQTWFGVSPNVEAALTLCRGRRKR